MNLRAEFLRAHRTSASGRRLFAAGAVALAAAAFICVQLAQQIQDAGQALASADARLRVRDAQQRDTIAQSVRDGGRGRADRTLREYALSFPWNDLFRALESLQATKVLSLTVSVDAGHALIELDSSSTQAAERAVDQLKRTLPEFDVLLTRQNANAAHVRTVLDARDRRFDPGAADMDLPRGTSAAQRRFP